MSRGKERGGDERNRPSASSSSSSPVPASLSLCFTQSLSFPHPKLRRSSCTCIADVVTRTDPRRGKRLCVCMCRAEAERRPLSHSHSLRLPILPIVCRFPTATPVPVAPAVNRTRWGRRTKTHSGRWSEVSDSFPASMKHPETQQEESGWVRENVTRSKALILVSLMDRLPHSSRNKNTHMALI